VLLSGRSAATVAAFGHAYATSGDIQNALEQVAELERQGRQGYVSPYYLAVVYAGLDDKDRAFGELEKAYKNRDDNLFDLNVDPWFDKLRLDPRFKDLLLRLPSEALGKALNLPVAIASGLFGLMLAPVPPVPAHY
jgi:hypothetical protein